VAAVAAHAAPVRAELGLARVSTSSGLTSTGYTRHEMRYGSFTRTLPLADGATESDIKANYKHGILEIRVPVTEQIPASEPTKIAVSTD
jgi:HSP20 family molecular chaperone IbpA